MASRGQDKAIPKGKDAALRYRLYGLTLESRLALACPPARKTARPDVELIHGSAQRFARARALADIPARTAQWFECFGLPDGSTYLRWDRLFEFLISGNGRTIEYRAREHASREALTTYLLGQVLSFSLLSLGFEPLHATAVIVGGRAIAFVGDCGYGKSTIGAAFVARGYPVLTDDVLALQIHEHGCLAHPGPARLKLFPSVARSLLGRTDTRRMNPGTRKLVLRLTEHQATADAVPLDALYCLCGPARSRRASRVSVTPLTGQRAFLEVIRAAFNLIRVDKARLEHQFRMATELVKVVPVSRLTYPRRLTRLDEVCDAVLASRAWASATPA